MFTGIILGQGEIAAVERRRDELRLRVYPLFPLADPKIGESIAVNGACLTVEAWDGRTFSAYASAETLSCTALGDLRHGERVNLERALALGERLGGHLVSGHVDTVASVESIHLLGDSRCCRLNFEPAWSTQIIPKGSVALDGISLTVNNCGTGWLEVNVIPETWRVTTVSAWKTGRKVNLETDVIGKYVSRLLVPYADEKKHSSGLTMEFLQENGFAG